MQANSVRIPHSEFSKILAHGEQTFPEECCGVLIGKLENGSFQVDEARAMRNTNEGSKNTRFNIDPFDLIKLEDELDEQGRLMIGIYHSHPNHPAKPSETDLKFAWPNLSYIVLRVDDGKADKITSWTLQQTNETKKFVELSLHTE